LSLINVSVYTVSCWEFSDVCKLVISVWKMYRALNIYESSSPVLQLLLYPFATSVYFWTNLKISSSHIKKFFLEISHQNLLCFQAFRMFTASLAIHSTAMYTMQIMLQIWWFHLYATLKSFKIVTQKKQAVFTDGGIGVIVSILFHHTYHIIWTYPVLFVLDSHCLSM